MRNKQKLYHVLLPIAVMLTGLAFFTWFYTTLPDNPRARQEVLPILIFVGVGMALSIAGVLFNAYMRPGLFHKRLRKCLQGYGLKAEKSETFTGYKGTYNGYFIKVHTGRISHFGVVLYYMPFANKAGRIDYRALQRIADDHSFSVFWRNAKLTAEPAYLLATERINLLTAVYDANRCIKKLLTITTEEQLKPLTEEEWQRLLTLNREEFREPEEF